MGGRLIPIFKNIDTDARFVSVDFNYNDARKVNDSKFIYFRVE